MVFGSTAGPRFGEQNGGPRSSNAGGTRCWGTPRNRPASRSVAIHSRARGARAVLCSSPPFVAVAFQLATLPSLPSRRDGHRRRPECWVGQLHDPRRPTTSRRTDLARGSARDRDAMSDGNSKPSSLRAISSRAWVGSRTAAEGLGMLGRHCAQRLRAALRDGARHSCLE